MTKFNNILNYLTSHDKSELEIIELIHFKMTKNKPNREEYIEKAWGLPDGLFNDLVNFYIELKNLNQEDKIVGIGDELDKCDEIFAFGLHQMKFNEPGPSPVSKKSKLFNCISIIRGNKHD